MRKLLSLLLIFFLFFISCKQKETYKLKDKYIDKPSYGDAIITASIGEPSTLNPVLASDSASHDIIGLVFNGLVKFDKDLNLIGDLAEKWDILEGGKIIVFYLKKGVKWHDGVEFTARDVKFTYDSFMNPMTKTAYRSLFEPIKSVEIINDYKIKVTYKTVFAPALQYWGLEIIPYHLLHDKDINTADFNRNPVGTGPYKFVKWQTADRIELVANENYFDGKPYISKYIYRVIPDQSVQFMEMISGGVDMMDLNSELYTTRANTEKFNKNFNKYKITGFSYIYFGFNLNNELFKDKKVRKAINYAINKDEIIQGVKKGLAVRTTGPYIPGTWAYNNSDEVEKYDYNPELAKKLLAEAGFQYGKDGLLYKQDKKFQFTIITNQGNKEREEIATIIQQQLLKIGIKAEVRILAWNILITEFVDKKKFDAIVLGWSTGLDPDNYDTWHSSKTKEGEFNFISYKNLEVDKLLIEARTTFDIKKRAAAYKKIHKIIADDSPYVFLYSPFGLPAVHKRFHGIVPAPAGIGYNFTKWYVPQELIKYKFDEK
jgi:peptide/nickel transport system substrate-binding protein